MTEGLSSRYLVSVSRVTYAGTSGLNMAFIGLEVSGSKGWVGTSLEAVRLLCSSPLVEPAVRNSRNGLHRLHSREGGHTVG
jgi:hypothetical protein